MHPGEGVELLRRDDLALRGIGGRALTKLLRAGELRPVRHGVFVSRADVVGLREEDRMLVRARALALVSRHRPVFSHLTAAAFHGLPLAAISDSAVHAIVSDTRPSAGAGLVRHRGTLAHDDVIEHDGLRITSLVRTVADITRTARHETAVCIADAALRRAGAFDSREGDPAAAETFRREAGRIARLSAQGAWRAIRVLEFADGRADGPGESISRIRLAQLGFARPRLQVSVPGPNGTTYFVDFGLDEAAALGEFDGASKYADPAMRGGRTPEQVVDAEKRREDWIRGVTGRPVVRWGWEHIASASLLGQRLAAFGVVPARG